MRFHFPGYNWLIHSFTLLGEFLVHRSADGEDDEWYLAATLLTILTSSQGILTTLSQSNGGYEYDYATDPFLAEVFKVKSCGWPSCDSLFSAPIQRVGAIFNMTQLLLDDFKSGFEKGPCWQRILNGYTITTWMVVLNLGSTGLLVSWLMKYADNIVKACPLLSFESLSYISVNDPCTLFLANNNPCTQCISCIFFPKNNVFLESKISNCNVKA
ncbi:CMP-sialic acid transporter 1-like [Prosopis cineraria]|uniref:CMP-sialic acid transporter 1-like n=1 Tax=Prosopis cineraria TaxID=364024 RepID=UPI00241076C5|nr:CMP-sialic acid transporter 1-like [Prosopis cineraria]